MRASLSNLGCIALFTICSIACQSGPPSTGSMVERTPYDGELSPSTEFHANYLHTDKNGAGDGTNELMGDFLRSAKLKSGRLALAFYNASCGCLEVNIEKTAGKFDFSRHQIHGEESSIIGHYIDLKADGESLHVVAQNKTHKKLYYLPIKSNGFPEPELVDGGMRNGFKHEVGFWPSFAEDSEGRQFVTHFDRTAQNLWLNIREPGAGWRHFPMIPTTTDSAFSATTELGPHSSILINAKNEVYIGFRNATLAHAVVARVEPGEKGWSQPKMHFQTLDFSDNVGTWIRGTLDPAGNPHFAYYDADNGNLKLVRHNGKTFQDPVVVDNQGHTGTDIDLAWYRGNHLLIAYLAIGGERFAFDPKLAFEKDDGSFGTVTLAEVGVGGFFNAVETDINGKPIVFDHLSFLPSANTQIQQNQKIRRFTVDP